MEALADGVDIFGQQVLDILTGESGGAFTVFIGLGDGSEDALRADFMFVEKISEVESAAKCDDREAS